ncbi:hypothetical protein R6Q57_018514 [Mikania cordata]
MKTPKRTTDFKNGVLANLQNQGGKYKFEGLHPLKKFGQFGEAECMDAGEEPEIPNAVILNSRWRPYQLKVIVLNLPTTENIEALLEHVKRSVGNPPPTSSFIDQEPPFDNVADLIPRKRRRRDPRPGIVVR